jgi:hypothetical protein
MDVAVVMPSDFLTFVTASCVAPLKRAGFRSCDGTFNARMVELCLHLAIRLHGVVLS